MTGCDWFEVMHKALCCLSKEANIPEVEAIIRLITPQAEGFWAGLAEESADVLEERLLTFNQVQGGAPGREDRFMQDLLVVLLSLILSRSRNELPRILATSIERAARILMRQAAKTAGFHADPAENQDLALVAREDLLNMLRGRIQQHEPELKRVVQQWLRGTLRSLRGPLGDDLDRELPKALTAWRAKLREVLGSQTRTWVPAVTDLWAYRWWNVGIVTAGRAAGVLAWEAVAVRDGRTTAFCIWVDGKLVSVTKIERQLATLFDASRSSEAAAWPLLDQPSEGPVERFEEFFASAAVGLPPYHWRCRTRVRPVRLR